MAKYNNVKIDGYDSKKEYRRAKELKLLEKKDYNRITRASKIRAYFASISFLRSARSTEDATQKETDRTRRLLHRGFRLLSGW